MQPWWLNIRDFFQKQLKKILIILCFCCVYYVFIFGNYRTCIIIYIAIELYKIKYIISHTVLLLLLLLDISSTSTSDTTATPTSTDTQQLQSSASLDSSSSLPDSSTLFEPIKTDPSDRKCLCL